MLTNDIVSFEQLGPDVNCYPDEQMTCHFMALSAVFQPYPVSERLHAMEALFTDDERFSNSHLIQT